MNERQRRFAEFYAASGNAAEAARLAGYSERTARSQGQRLLTNDDILRYVRELQDQAAAGRIADLEEIKETWTKVLRSDSERTANRLRAGELLARSAGEFIRPGQPRRVGADDTVDTPSGEQADTVIALPWNGRQAINAVENEYGAIVPFPGAEDDDLLVMRIKS